MDFTRETVRKIRGLIVFAVIVVVVGVNYRTVLDTAAGFLRMLAPFLAGGAVAFGLNVPMRFFENKMDLGRWNRYKRPLCLVLTLIAVCGVLGIVMVVVIPELVRTVMVLENSVPLFFARVQTQLLQVFADFPEIETYISSIQVNWDEVIRQTAAFLGHGAGTVLSTTVSAAMSIVNGLASFFIAFVFAIYILVQKETLARQASNVVRAFLPDRAASECIRVAALTERTFSHFLTGQCVEAVILGSMFFVTLSLLRMPYALLIGVLIAFTALIPIFGAFIGCVVGIFLMLLVSPVKALIFLGVFLVLQQLEGNLIYPRVVGGSVGLPSIWVLVAVTLGGSMMGIIGMLIFIPLVSVVYTLLREVVRSRLRQKREQKDQEKEQEKREALEQ